MKISEFLSENFQFLEVKFSIYLNRRVFVMYLPYNSDILENNSYNKKTTANNNKQQQRQQINKQASRKIADTDEFGLLRNNNDKKKKKKSIPLALSSFERVAVGNIDIPNNQ